MVLPPLSPPISLLLPCGACLLGRVGSTPFSVTTRVISLLCILLFFRSFPSASWRQCAEQMGDVVDLRRVKCGWLSPAQARSINGDAGELARFVRGLPKAELHVHIEGTFEPETMLAIALRNGLEGKLAGYDGDAEAWCESQRSLRKFDDLQGFLDLYYAGCDVLRSEDDFYDLCMSYCRKAAAGGVRRAEIFFDPQTHTVERNALPLSVVINGLHRACVDAKTGLGLDAALIMCFLRHRHPGQHPPSRCPSRF